MTPPRLAALGEALRGVLGGPRVHVEAPLAPLTTFRIGGPADLLVEVRNADELERVLHLARQHEVAVTMLGGGSNVLVSDGGLRGLVVRAHGGSIVRTEAGIRADAGVTVNGLVRWSVQHELGGLAAWAGTPGTLGGAIHGNAHFDGRLIGERVLKARVAGPDGTASTLRADEMEFGYDESRLQRTREVLLWAELRVEPATASVLRDTARGSLRFRKRTQPLALPSAGCVFRNPEPEDGALPPGMPASAGALVDAAGLKGVQHGGARFSPVHANFIVNEGGARASDVAALLERARAAVLDRFGVRLREEIVRLGER
jgi:UDP-N-acetylmuramate dehydrogenase